jgi:hypothetical protein
MIYRVAQDELDAGQLRHAKVTIVYARSNSRCLGRCTYGTELHPRVNMTLVLPRPGAAIDLVELAKVVAHELGHAKGLHHRDMHNTRYGREEGWRERYAWAADFPINLKLLPPEKTREEKLMLRRTDAVVKAETMIVKLHKAQSRAVVLLKQWEQRLKKANAVFKTAYIDRRPFAIVAITMAADRNEPKPKKELSNGSKKEPVKNAAPWHIEKIKVTKAAKILLALFIILGQFANPFSFRTQKHQHGRHGRPTGRLAGRQSTNLREAYRAS